MSDSIDDILNKDHIFKDIDELAKSVEDNFDNNPDELLITHGGENSPPIIAGDNTYASPAGVERIGANTTTISATFADSDLPGVSAFNVSFKLRLPNDISD